MAHAEPTDLRTYGRRGLGMCFEVGDQRRDNLFDSVVVQRIFVNTPPINHEPGPRTAPPPNLLDSLKPGPEAHGPLRQSAMVRE